MEYNSAEYFALQNKASSGANTKSCYNLYSKVKTVKRFRE